MALEVNRPSGPEYKQTSVPTNKTLGNLWFNPNGGNCSMSNGEAYGGEYKRVGIAGYVAGGGVETSIEKLTFYTEDITVIASSLTQEQNDSATNICNLEKGFFVGGNQNGTKLTFSTGVTSAVASLISSKRGGASGFHSDNYGYVANGVNDSSVLLASADKINFSTDSFSETLATVGVPVAYSDGTQSGSSGYVFAGSLNASNTVLTSTVQKLTFSNDAVSSLSNNVSVARYHGASGQSDVRGYYASGTISGGPSVTTTLNRLVFSNDAISVISHGITGINSYCGFSSYMNTYFAGGYTGVTLDIVLRLYFTTEFYSLLAETLTTPRYSHCSVENLN